MAEAVGTAGGVMMIALVVLFAMLLGSEARVLPVTPDRAKQLWLRLAGWTGACAAVAAGAWVIRTVCVGECGVLDWAAVWQRLTVGADCARFTSFEWSALLREGCFPLTALAYHGLGSVLLGEHTQAQLTLGLLLGGASLLMASEQRKNGGAWLLCFPGAALLFLPGAASLGCALWLASECCRASGRRAWQTAFAALCCAAHPFGAGVLAAALLQPLFGKEWQRALLIAAVCAAAAAAFPLRRWDLLPAAGILLLAPGSVLTEKKYGAAAVCAGALAGGAVMLLMMK